MGQQHKSNDEAAYDVSHDHLQKGQIAVVSETRHADDGQRAGFSRNDGQRNRPPWDVASGEEVVAQCALPFTKSQAEQSDADQVNCDDSEVETVEAHAVELAYRGRSTIT